jgi:hypothetical protein
MRFGLDAACVPAAKEEGRTGRWLPMTSERGRILQCGLWLQQSGTGDCRPKFSSRRDVPGSTHTTTEWDLRYAKWGPQELSLCTGTAHLVALWLDSAFAGSLASTKFCYRPNWTGTFTVLSHSRLGVLSQCGFFPFSFQINFLLIFLNFF